jgi:hypothetical protein
MMLKFLLTKFTCGELGCKLVKEVEASPCEGKLVLLSSGFLCLAPYGSWV